LALLNRRFRDEVLAVGLGRGFAGLTAEESGSCSYFDCARRGLRES
jgi:hypothetical protein